MNTTRNTESYNVAVWRIVEGKPVSVQAARLEGSRIVRASGTWTYDNGTDAYHYEFVIKNSQFMGKPVELVVSSSVNDVSNAMRNGFEKTFVLVTKLLTL